jgi:hypothetical protein
LVWALIRAIEANRLNLGMAGIVVREDQPVAYWALVAGVAAVVALLLLCATALVGAAFDYLPIDGSNMPGRLHAG